MFSTQSENCIPINFVNIFDIISSFAAELGEPKIGISGKGLKVQLNLLETTAVTLSSISTHFNLFKKKAVGKQCGKG